MALDPRFAGLDAWDDGGPRGADRLWLASGVIALVLSALLAGPHLLIPTPRTMPAPAPDPAVLAALEQQTQTLNTVMTQLARPWQLWLRRAVLDLPAEHALLRLDIDAEARRLQIEVTADDFAAIEALVERLQRSAAFTSVRTLSHTADATGELRATLEAGLP